MTDRSHRRQLDGKVALITGGSSGIGLAIAQTFAAEGAKVAIAGTDQEKAEKVARQIREGSGTAIALTGDVGVFATGDRLVADTVRELGPIDILVNSAGLWYPTTTGELREPDVDRMIAVNLKGTLAMINAAAPLMKAQRSGRIINLASVAGQVAAPGYSLYCSLKAAIIMLTKVLALELAPFDIAVNAIAPGNTETPMNEHIRLAPEFAERRAWIKSITPSERLFTPPEEIAEAALFLANGRVRAMYGTTLFLDEGRSAGSPMKPDFRNATPE